MPAHPNSSRARTPATLVLLALLAQDASAFQWSSPRAGDMISPGDMILAAWQAEKKIDSPILRLCSQGVGDQEADCSVLGGSGFSHRKDGELVSLFLVPENVSPGKSYFQVEVAGEVHDSPHFSVLKPVQQQSDAVLDPSPPATGTVQDLELTVPPIELVTQTTVIPVTSSSQEVDIPAPHAISPSLESPSWLPRLPAKPAVRLDSHDPNIVGLATVIMVVLFALAAVGALVAILWGRRKRNGQLSAIRSYHRDREAKADSRLTRLPDKRLNAAPTVQYLPNLHSLGIHTVSEGSYSDGASTRVSLEDVRLTPRIPFPSPKNVGTTKGH